MMSGAKGEVYRRVAVLTGPRRRDWSADEKARVVAEICVPGAAVPSSVPGPSLEGMLAGAVLHVAPCTDGELLTTVLRAILASAG